MDGPVVKVKKSKKRKAEQAAAADAPAPAAAAAAPAPGAEASKKKKRKKEAPTPEIPATRKQPKPVAAATSNSSTASDDTTVGEVVAPADPLAVANFRLCAASKAKLAEKGIAALFPIQAQTLAHTLDGFDVVGRARTGCGKTLAFVLPIVERLSAADAAKPSARGRAPRVIVLTPTRELAKQVHADFQWISSGCGLATLCLYGGAQYSPQESALKRGVDIVVGTPGRVKDHLERGTLDLSQISFRVLDECDEMLNMGFVDDVEQILSTGTSGAAVQTLLFSATLPSWVKSITQRFLQKSHKLVDLVGMQKIKASTTVKHLMLPCHWSQRTEVTSALVACYGALGSTIVFTETKRTADELASALGESLGARALHGDIPQTQRESTLAGFRSKKFRVLVATDVAARGLDIKNVELVVQTDPPKDPETYIHRSGRTGRAGSTGVCVTLVDRKKEGLIPLIERKAGVTLQRIGTPQPSDLARVAGERAAEALQSVSEEDAGTFLEAADQLLEDMDARQALARALVQLTGHTSLQARSLLTAHEGFTSLLFRHGTAIQRPGFVFATLKSRGIPEDTVEQVKRMTMAADEHVALFDVPSDLVQTFTDAFAGQPAGQPTLAVATQLPKLKETHSPPAWQERGGSSFGRGGRGSFGGSRGGASGYSGPRNSAGRGRGGFSGGRGGGSSRGGPFRGRR